MDIQKQIKVKYIEYLRSSKPLLVRNKFSYEIISMAISAGITYDELNLPDLKWGTVRKCLTVEELVNWYKFGYNRALTNDIITIANTLMRKSDDEHNHKLFNIIWSDYFTNKDRLEIFSTMLGTTLNMYDHKLVGERYRLLNGYYIDYVEDVYNLMIWRKQYIQEHKVKLFNPFNVYHRYRLYNYGAEGSCKFWLDVADDKGLIR